MEYKIEENRINKLVFDFLEDYFKNDEIHYHHPYDQYRDEWGDEVEGENPNVIEYYIGDYYEDDLLFRLYFKDYWTGTNSTADKRRSESPLLTITDNNLENSLDGMFSEQKVWEEGLKIWFTYKFDLKVNRVR
jgi:hypothetical protein